MDNMQNVQKDHTKQTENSIPKRFNSKFPAERTEEQPICEENVDHDYEYKNRRCLIVVKGF